MHVVIHVCASRGFPPETSAAPAGEARGCSHTLSPPLLLAVAWHQSEVIPTTVPTIWEPSNGQKTIDVVPPQSPDFISPLTSAGDKRATCAIDVSRVRIGRSAFWREIIGHTTGAVGGRSCIKQPMRRLRPGDGSEEGECRRKLERQPTSLAAKA